MKAKGPTLRTLRADIEQYIVDAGGFEMADLREKAEACQAEIEELGYTWDDQRALWRAPTED